MKQIRPHPVVVFFLSGMLNMVGLHSVAVAATPVLAAEQSAPPFVERLADPATLAQLRRGGFALYFRHGVTDNRRADQVPAVDLNDCSTQRPLTAAGRQLAAKVGLALRQARIPITEIHISPMCRVKETAAAAFPGRKVQVDLNLMYTGNLTDAQKAPIIARTRDLLSMPVAPGTNRLVIAHAPNLMDLMGYFPKETTLVVLRPQPGGKFDYVASISPGLWAELLSFGAKK